MQARKGGLGNPQECCSDAVALERSATRTAVDPILPKRGNADQGDAVQGAPNFRRSGICARENRAGLPRLCGGRPTIDRSRSSNAVRCTTAAASMSISSSRLIAGSAIPLTPGEPSATR
jgi:hypothetical protein